MQDLLLIAMALTVCIVTGYPACRLLPVQSYRDRIVAAPVMGFALTSAATILLYKLGVPPRTSLWALCALGTAGTVIQIRRERALMPVRGLVGVAGSAAVIVVVCLLPGWIGGETFKVFQGNVYDQFYSYLPGSVTFHRYSYSTVRKADANPASNPVIVEAWHAAVSRPISIVHAAFAGTHATALSSAYAFLAALRVQMFFAALFMALSVFKASLRTGVVVAGALTVGFFQQYVVDIDAWSELSTLPVCVLVVAVTALTVEFSSDGVAARRTFWKVTALYGLLFLPVTVIYPEAWPVYAVAGAAALVSPLRGQRAVRVTAAIGIVVACTIALLLSAWFGSLAYVTSTTREAFTPVVWWHYFQGYVLGPTAIAGPAAAGSYSSVLSASWFILPIDAAVATIGLYWFLPGTTVQPLLAAPWRLALYVFVLLLVVGLVRAAFGTSRDPSLKNPRRLLRACLASLVTPAGFLIAGLLRTAGKALSIATPLLFFVLAAPLLVRWPLPRRERIAAMLFVAAHLLTGVLGPVLAGSAGGTILPGLPGSAPLLAMQKSGMDWRMDRLVEELKGCDRLIVDVRQPFMSQAVQLVATDLAMQWGSTQPTTMPSFDGPRVKPPYQPPGWTEADCIATDSRSDLQSGRKVIWVTSDNQTFRFLDAATGALELGVADHPGVTVLGGYAIEETPSGSLRWTSGLTTIRVPNSDAAPATSLLVSCWPIRQSSDTTLRITINGWIAFEGPVPHQVLTIPLTRTAKDDLLVIELTTSPLTHFPADPRDLGVALRQVMLEKRP